MCADAGKHEEAIAAAHVYGAGAAHPSPDAISALGYAYAQSGRRAEARRLIAELLKRSEHEYIAPYEFALIHVALGEHDESLQWIELGLRRGDPKLRRLKVDPKLDPSFSLPASGRCYRLLSHGQA